MSEQLSLGLFKYDLTFFWDFQDPSPHSHIFSSIPILTLFEESPSPLLGVRSYLNSPFQNPIFRNLSILFIITNYYFLVTFNVFSCRLPNVNFHFVMHRALLLHPVCQKHMISYSTNSYTFIKIQSWYDIFQGVIYTYSMSYSTVS